ncbi:SET domain-containing protein, partial [Polyplosphaeria fusca]
YFWCESPDGIPRLATSADGSVPKQVNAYTFDPELFCKLGYPCTFPPGHTWPPKTATDLLIAIGDVDSVCVGDKCYTAEQCSNKRCNHTLAVWELATQGWQDYFELRMTEDRGIGAFTLKPFKEGEVLGWYSGEIKPANDKGSNSDYLMEIDVGEISDPLEWDGSVDASMSYQELNTRKLNDEAAMIDANEKGNWTRFINHSCDPWTSFCVRRVGDTRIMTVEAARDIPAGIELTVSYGVEYYGPETGKICQCGAVNCVGRKQPQNMDDEKKRRVKKSKRVTSP